jgi:hypothetical protein
MLLLLMSNCKSAPAQAGGTADAHEDGKYRTVRGVVLPCQLLGLKHA